MRQEADRCPKCGEWGDDCYLARRDEQRGHKHSLEAQTRPTSLWHCGLPPHRPRLASAPAATLGTTRPQGSPDQHSRTMAKGTGAQSIRGPGEEALTASCRVLQGHCRIS